MNKQMDNNREQLMSIVKTQTKNLHFLEHSSSEANILLDMNHRVLYFDKLGEVYFKNATFYSPTDFRADLPHFLLKIPVLGSKP